MLLDLAAGDVVTYKSHGGSMFNEAASWKGRTA
jgi:hypothetical protein